MGKMKNERKLMGLILDGNSDIDVHVWCKIDYLICLRIRFRFQPNCDLIKYFFLFQYKSNIIDIPLLYCTFNKNCKKSYIFEGYEILMFIPDPVSNPSKFLKIGSGSVTKVQVLFLNQINESVGKYEKC